MPTDIKLDTSTHDIDLTKGGTLHTDSGDALGQRMKIALLLRKTEWRPNLNKGVPYHQDFFTVKNNKSFIDAFYQNYLLGLDDVSSIESYTSTVSNGRKLEVSVTVKTTQGTIENFITEI